jgi:hypothetical protein
MTARLTPAQLVEQWLVKMPKGALSELGLRAESQRADCAAQLAAALAVAPSAPDAALRDLRKKVALVMTERCIDRSCEGGDTNSAQAASSEQCRDFYGKQRVDEWCDMCLFNEAIAGLESLLAFRRPVDAPDIKAIRAAINADLKTASDRVLTLELENQRLRAVASVPASPPTREGWQPMETAPKMRTILLFAVTDIAKDGTVRNWKMATGAWHTGYEDARSLERGYSPWEWGGHQLKTYEVQPTHWMPLPPAPAGSPAPQEGK